MRLLVTDAAAQPPRQATAWLIMTLGRKMKIYLTETSTWTGTLFDLQINSGEATFIGSGIYEGIFPRKMVLKPDALQQLQDALTMLEVFGWREAYKPEDIGATVDDGGSWSLSVSDCDKSILSHGENAAPSYKSPDITTVYDERYGLLREAVFSALRLSIPFGFKKSNRA